MLDVKLLGQFEVLRDGTRLTIPSRNAQSLFAYLILNAGKAHRREMLAGIFWPDSSEDNARSNLRHELWRLRKAIDSKGKTYFLIHDLAIAFDPNSEYSLDVHQLESAAADGSTVDELIGALSSYHGELLPGFYDEWIFPERSRLNTLFEAMMVRLLEKLQTERRWSEVLDWGMRWISIGQWPEPAYRAVMSAYANLGDLSKAAATYDRFAHGIQKDLGIKPSEQTRALYKRIKAGWKVDAQPASTGGTLPRKPQSMTVSPGFPLPWVRRSNLPKPMTSFIGREKEMQQVEHLVSGERLVTITGSGGVGKTRLAIQVAEALTPRYRDGVWWVELAPLFKSAPPKKWDLSPPRKRDFASPRKHDFSTKRNLTYQPGSPVAYAVFGERGGVDLVAQAVAKALRVPDTPGLPVLEGVLEYLRDKQLLLVLDNCEHLIEDCAIMVDRVLSDCAEVSILTTSREALGVPGEKAWLLPSLSLPGQGRSISLSTIFQSEAASLFVERAAEVLPGYQPGEADVPIIVQICSHLGGIPLAIELAAARMNMLSVQEIAARLDRRFSLLTTGHRTALPRHQTLRAAIEWSYDLLSKPEQVLMRRLCVFSGSFTLEAAEAVCAGQDIVRDDVLALLGRLVDKSLLTVEPSSRDTGSPTRYRFLDTICSFGRLELDEAGEIQMMRERHAAYYVRLMETAESEILFHNQVYWHKLLQAEHDNLRAVVEWSAESDLTESALRLVGASLWFWYIFGSHREGYDLALKALASPSAARYPRARAKALNTAGYLQCILGDTVSAKRSLEEALSILRVSDDKASMAWSLQFLGLVFAFEREYDQSDAAFKEGLAIAGNLVGRNTNSFLFFLGDVDLQRGDRSRAKKIYEESVKIFRANGNKSFLAYPLRRLGYLALESNDVPAAREYLQESLALNHDVGDKPGLTACLASMAALAMDLGEPVMAARLYGAVENRLETLSIYLLPTDQAELRQIGSRLRSILDEATFAAAFAEGWEMSEEKAIELTEAI